MGSLRMSIDPLQPQDTLSANRRCTGTSYGEELQAFGGKSCLPSEGLLAQHRGRDLPYRGILLPKEERAVVRSRLLEFQNASA